MKQRLFLATLFFFFCNFAYSQQTISASSTGKVKPNSIQKVQNEKARFSMAITPMSTSEEKAAFFLFPNDHSNALYLKSRRSQSFSYALYNLDGEELIIKDNLQEMTLVDLSIYEEGVYILEVQVGYETEMHRIVLR